MNKTAQLVYDLSLPIAESLSLEIWDVEYIKEAGQWFLRVYIDKQGGVSINDCEAFSRALDPILDEKDPIAESYVFEVSSAGLDRDLKRPSDFVRFIGENVEVRLYKSDNGAKVHSGALSAFHEGNVVIRTADGSELEFQKDNIAAVKLHLI